MRQGFFLIISTLSGRTTRTDSHFNDYVVIKSSDHYVTRRSLAM